MQGLIKKSGSVSKTLLWQNPDTTINFENQDVTLLDSVANYDYIMINYKNNKTTSDSSTDKSLVNNVLMKPNNNVYDTNSLVCTISSIYSNNPYSNCWRRVLRFDNNICKITNCMRNDTVSRHDYVIPIAIYGIKGLNLD